MPPLFDHLVKFVRGRHNRIAVLREFIRDVLCHHHRRIVSGQFIVEVSVKNAKLSRPHIDHRHSRGKRKRQHTSAGRKGDCHGSQIHRNDHDRQNEKLLRRTKSGTCDKLRQPEERRRIDNHKQYRYSDQHRISVKQLPDLFAVTSLF